MLFTSELSFSVVITLPLGVFTTLSLDESPLESTIEYICPSSILATTCSYDNLFLFVPPSSSATSHASILRIEVIGCVLVYLPVIEIISLLDLPLVFLLLPLSSSTDSRSFSV